MIRVKEAVANAVHFLQDVYEKQAFQDVRLEEIELSEDEDIWHVTLSFERPRGGPIPAALGLPGNREYKTMAVSSSTGDVQSMKIRTF
ncbi:MAG: hypothetical protein ACYTG0_11330 [Planctomycetota bacterium]|jgi:hypothetical protein